MSTLWKAAIDFKGVKRLAQMLNNTSHRTIPIKRDPMSLTDLEKEIISYLLKHPEAQDSIEGITEWWLLEERITSALQDVEKAVTRLEEQGLLIENILPGGKRVFRLNKSRDAEIQTYIKS